MIGCAFVRVQRSRPSRGRSPAASAGRPHRRAALACPQASPAATSRRPRRESSKRSRMCRWARRRPARSSRTHHPRRGRVREDELAVGAVDDDRLVEDRHHRVHPPLDALEVGEQAGVVERQADASGEDLAEAQVVDPVAAPDHAVISVSAPRLRSRARSGITIDERRSERSQELEVVGASGPSGAAPRRSSPATTRAGGATSARPEAASPAAAAACGADGPRSPGVRLARCRTASRDARPSWIASIMQMSANAGTTVSVTRRSVSASGSEPSATPPTALSRCRRSARSGAAGADQALAIARRAPSEMITSGRMLGVAECPCSKRGSRPRRRPRPGRPRRDQRTGESAAMNGAAT